MSLRGGALALGAGVTAAALAFGSRPVAVAGIGLLLAGGLSRAWAGLARGGVSVALTVEPERVTEGDPARLRALVTRRSRVPVGHAALELELGKLGVFEIRLLRRGRALRGELDLGRPPRGVYALTGAGLVLRDHLGLGDVLLPVQAAGATIVVYPRLVSLSGPFGDGTRRNDGRRFLPRRSSGFDFHSVRDYEQGESLRRVHWPTTARRGQLMVKELHDAPADVVVVILDCDPAGAAGRAPESSFDVAVRAAGSIAKAVAERGRSACLVTTGHGGVAQLVRPGQADLEALLTTLAAAEPDAAHGLARSLRSADRAIARSAELAIVSGAPLAGAAPALLQLAAHCPVSVTWIDTPSFAGRPTRADAGLLRLASVGVPVSVVRRGDDLATAAQVASTRSAARA
jgi:uncharacterized protein (DUF58 family)